MLPSNAPEQLAAKKALLAEAEERLELLKLSADLLITAELTKGNAEKRDGAGSRSHEGHAICP
jgi:hypothetical protein